MTTHYGNIGDRAFCRVTNPDGSFSYFGGDIISFDSGVVIRPGRHGVRNPINLGPSVWGWQLIHSDDDVKVGDRVFVFDDQHRDGGYFDYVIGRDHNTRTIQVNGDIPTLPSGFWFKVGPWSYYGKQSNTPSNGGF